MSEQQIVKDTAALMQKLLEANHPSKFILQQGFEYASENLNQETHPQPGFVETADSILLKAARIVGIKIVE